MPKHQSSIKRSRTMGLVWRWVLAAFLIGWRAVRWLLQRNKPVPQRAKDPRRSGNPARRNAG